MSYDILLGKSDFNFTSNITSMTSAGGLHLMDLDGQTGAEAQGQVAACLRYLTNPTNHRELRKLEPLNKWGTLEQLIVFLNQLYFACIDNPHATMTVTC